VAVCGGGGLTADARPTAGGDALPSENGLHPPASISSISNPTTSSVRSDDLYALRHHKRPSTDDKIDDVIKNAAAANKMSSTASRDHQGVDADCRKKASDVGAELKRDVNVSKLNYTYTVSHENRACRSLLIKQGIARRNDMPSPCRWQLALQPPSEWD